MSITHRLSENYNLAAFNQIKAEYYASMSSILMTSTTDMGEGQEVAGNDNCQGCR